MLREELTPALGREEVLAEYHNVTVVLVKDVKLPMQGAQSSPTKVRGWLCYRIRVVSKGLKHDKALKEVAIKNCVDVVLRDMMGLAVLG